MMLRCLIFFLAFKAFAGLDPIKTRNANKAKEKAEKAIASNDYKTAIQAYNYLLDTLKIKDDKAMLNLAHAYMKKADYSNAMTRYTEATKSSDPKIKSIASQQLGILQSEKGNREEAQAYFKNAIKFDPSNTQARFNYELMLKNKNKDIPKSQDKKQRQEEEKKNEEKKDQQKKDQDKQENKGDQENKEPGKGDKKEDGEKNKGEKESDKGKEGEKSEQKKNEAGKSDKNKEGDDKKENGKEGDKKPEDEKNKSSKNKEDENSKEKGKADKASEKGDQKKEKETPNISANKEQLQKMNMTEHQAKSILNAMRQGEVQYIQQMKRTGKHKNDKPKKDW